MRGFILYLVSLSNKRTFLFLTVAPFIQSEPLQQSAMFSFNSKKCRNSSLKCLKLTTQFYIDIRCDQATYILNKLIIN